MIYDDVVNDYSYFDNEDKEKFNYYEFYFSISEL